MIALQTPRQSTRNRQIHIEDPTTSLATKVMMEANVSVVAHRAKRRRHLIDLAPLHQDFEITINGPQRE